jgi:hypothetical protein
VELISLKADAKSVRLETTIRFRGYTGFDDVLAKVFYEEDATLSEKIGGFSCDFYRDIGSREPMVTMTGIYR